MPQRLLNFFGGNVMERLTDALAVFGIMSGLNPSIYEWLSDISTTFALFMPVLGCIWLGVQIWSRVARGK
ncbi:MAG TPA: hypothetical protein VK196_16980 [Magnetospirillum sp.]|nr:hypothetical protein [Magnetospirillum sp.]